MNFSQSTDDRLLAYYESIRLQIARSSELYRTDPNVKQFAERAANKRIERNVIGRREGASSILLAA